MTSWAVGMVLSEHLGAVRTVTSAWCLGAALTAQSCWHPITTLTAAFRRHAGRGRVRMAAVSDVWLREYEADSLKHET